MTMTTNEIQMLKDWFSREIDSLRSDAHSAREESREDHQQVKDSIASVADDVGDVKERVTRLEANDERRLKSLSRIQWGIATIIAAVPVVTYILHELNK